jgi:hypothetical protein
MGIDELLIIGDLRAMARTRVDRASGSTGG